MSPAVKQVSARMGKASAEKLSSVGARREMLGVREGRSLTHGESSASDSCCSAEKSHGYVLGNFTCVKGYVSLMYLPQPTVHILRFMVNDSTL